MSNRNGFTLIELLVVITILIVLTALTLALVNVTQDEDRVRSAAGTVQSFLEGARNRAIHAKEPRGVRFLTDTQNPGLITSLLYIGPPENFHAGQITVESDNLTIRCSTPEIHSQWLNLYNRQLIGNGSVLRFDREIYTIRFDTGRFKLTKPYSGVPGFQDYSLQLNPTVLPNQEPRQFPRDVVIDLEHSKIPAAWQSGQMDILFSPHGTVTGLSASEGIINLVIAEGVDVLQDLEPGHQAKEGNERIVSIRTQTGGISVHHVDPTDTDGTPGADDPFRFAASGEVAK